MQGINAAHRWQPMNDADRQALLALTALVAGSGEYERYKTSQAFDGTAQHPWWLETASLEKALGPTEGGVVAARMTEVSSN